MVKRKYNFNGVTWPQVELPGSFGVGPLYWPKTFVAGVVFPVSEWTEQILMIGLGINQLPRVCFET